jgi:LuxR family quorum-sensing system transcriptional regulator SinR
MRHEYFELLDWLEQTKPIEPQAFFDRMRLAYGISHLVYLDVVPYGRTMHVHRLHHTLPASQAATIVLDAVLPSLHFILASVKPIEHRHLRQQVPAAEAIFVQLERLGIGPEGISFPLLSRGNRRAALSVGLPLPPGETSLFLRHYGRDIQALAALFHAAMIEAERPAIKRHRHAAITPREREVLHWSAAGKSYWEIAMILGITERTVRFFMSNARQKLDVVSNTQAVAEAVWRGLIPHS